MHRHRHIRRVTMAALDKLGIALLVLIGLLLLAGGESGDSDSPKATRRGVDTATMPVVAKPFETDVARDTGLSGPR